MYTEQEFDILVSQIGLVSFSAIVLLISAGLTSHFIHGYGTNEARNLFLFLILFILVSYQYYYVIQAANFIPATKFFIYNV